MTMLVTLTVAELRAIVREEVTAATTVPPPADILDSDGAAALLCLGKKKVERMARAKELPAFRLGREWRFRRAEIVAWLERGGA